MTGLRIALAAVLILSLVAAAPVAGQETTNGTDITDIGVDHPVASNQSVDEFERTGYTSGELTRYRIRVAIAKDGDDVGLEPSLARDARNRYLRIDYNESHARTLRILIPRDYRTPYTMESVESYESDHVASYEPARDGEYLSITVRFSGSGTAILPLRVDDGAAYTIVERVDSRIKSVTGVSPLGRSGEWSYIDGETVAETPAYPVNTSADGVLIQYDAKPNQPEQMWLNAPQGENEDAPVYYFDRDGDDQLYIVTNSEQAPDVRIKQNPSRSDRVWGDINDIRLVPERIEKEVGGLWPF